MVGSRAFCLVETKLSSLAFFPLLCLKPWLTLLPFPPLLSLPAPGIRSSKTFFELHTYGWLCCFWFVRWLSHSFWAPVSSWFLTTPIAHIIGCLCCFLERCLPHRLSPTVPWFEKLGWDVVHGPSCSQSKKQVKTSQHKEGKKHPFPTKIGKGKENRLKRGQMR